MSGTRLGIQARFLRAERVATSAEVSPMRWRRMHITSEICSCSSVFELGSTPGLRPGLTTTGARQPHEGGSDENTVDVSSTLTFHRPPITIEERQTREVRDRMAHDIPLRFAGSRSLLETTRMPVLVNGRVLRRHRGIHRHRNLHHRNLHHRGNRRRPCRGSRPRQIHRRGLGLPFRRPAR